MRLRLLYPGKTLTEPLFLFVVIALVLLVVLLRRTRGDRAARRVIVALLVALFGLWFFATDVATETLYAMLKVDAPASRVAPEVIVIAGSGSLHGTSPELDVLTIGSVTRVVTGVEWWREHPRARLVMAGGDRTLGGLSTRTAELMRDQAIRLGVPPNAIVLETRSSNTREHPVGLLALPGITRKTRVGVVTSAYHMRRTAVEFRRHFATVIPHAVERGDYGPWTINSFLPSVYSLRDTTVLVHEWIGIAWYALRR